MSKHRIRDRRKRIRKIKRIRRGILSGIAVAGVVTIVFISWSAIAPETDETPESIATEIHIETKKEAETETPRTYRDVEFVPLPVPMTDADQ